ncbi:MAG TPA: hypothetical protein VGD68_13370 [Streptosporangiaceae bacterium]
MRKAAVLLAFLMLVLPLLAAGCARITEPASAQVLLGARTVTAGSQLTGRVVVDNHSGHALHVRGCDSLAVIVTLSSRRYHPALAAPSCAGTVTIPAGRSVYPVKVLASYLSCSVGHADGGLPECGSGDALPPLPAGTYQATLGGITGVAAPPPVDIRVTRP